jgi:hypothetical protein
MDANGHESRRIVTTGWPGWACRELIKAAVVGEPGPGEPPRLISRPRSKGFQAPKRPKAVFAGIFAFLKRPRKRAWDAWRKGVLEWGVEMVEWFGGWFWWFVREWVRSGWAGSGASGQLPNCHLPGRLLPFGHSR